MTCMIANTFSMMMDVLRSIFGKQDIPSNWTTSGCWSPGVTGLHLWRSEKWERGVLCCSWFFYFFRIGFRFGFLKNDRITKWSGYRSMKLNCSMCEDLINIIGELKAPGSSKASIIFVVLEGTMLIQQSKQNLSGILMKTMFFRLEIRVASSVAPWIYLDFILTRRWSSFVNQWKEHSPTI